MKHLRLNSIAQGSNISIDKKGYQSFIVDTDEKLEKEMTIFLNRKLFKIHFVVNKPNNPKTRIIGNFL
jgi:hypothetical protein